MQDRELEDQFVEELAALEQSGAGMPVIFRPSEAWSLLAILQLSLSHPALAKVAPGTAKFAKTFAQDIESRLCKTPAMKEVARRGWLPRDDEPEPPILTKPAAAPADKAPAKSEPAPAPTAPTLPGKKRKP